MLILLALFDGGVTKHQGLPAGRPPRIPLQDCRSNAPRRYELWECFGDPGSIRFPLLFAAQASGAADRPAANRRNAKLPRAPRRRAPRSLRCAVPAAISARMRHLLPSLSLALSLATACGSNDTADAGSSDDAGIARDTGPTSDATIDAGAASDGGHASDAGPPHDGGPAPDAGSEGVITAVLDTRCDYQRRIGTLDIQDAWGTRQTSLVLFDAPTPWFGPPALTDAACVFHQASRAPCECRDMDEVCNFAGACVATPRPLVGLTLTVTGSGESQSFTGSGDGDLWGTLSVPGDSFGARLQAPGAFTVEVPASEIPPALVNAAGRLEGSLDVPTGANITWTPSASGALVHTLIRINHHVPEPTFTECQVPASAGQMRIEEAMLTPLAVVTGLEFQGISHVRFAAAETPLGCLEVRFERHQYISLD